MILWDASLPFSLSAGFPNKVAVPCPKTLSLLSWLLMRWEAWDWTGWHLWHVPALQWMQFKPKYLNPSIFGTTYKMHIFYNFTIQSRHSTGMLSLSLASLAWLHCSLILLIAAGSLPLTLFCYILKSKEHFNTYTRILLFGMYSGVESWDIGFPHVEFIKYGCILS